MPPCATEGVWWVHSPCPSPSPLQVFHAITQLVLKQKREAEPQDAGGAGDKIVVRKGGKSGGGGKKKWSCTVL